MIEQEQTVSEWYPTHRKKDVSYLLEGAWPETRGRNNSGAAQLYDALWNEMTRHGFSRHVPHGTLKWLVLVCCGREIKTKWSVGSNELFSCWNLDHARENLSVQSGLGNHHFRLYLFVLTGWCLEKPSQITLMPIAPQFPFLQAERRDLECACRRRYLQMFPFRFLGNKNMDLCFQSCKLFTTFTHTHFGSLLKSNNHPGQHEASSSERRLFCDAKNQKKGAHSVTKWL